MDLRDVVVVRRSGESPFEIAADMPQDAPERCLVRLAHAFEGDQ